MIQLRGSSVYSTSVFLHLLTRIPKSTPISPCGWVSSRPYPLPISHPHVHGVHVERKREPRTFHCGQQNYVLDKLLKVILSWAAPSLASVVRGSEGFPPCVCGQCVCGKSGKMGEKESDSQASNFPSCHPRNHLQNLTQLWPTEHMLSPCVP